MPTRDDLARICVDLAAGEGGRVVDGAGPETLETKIFGRLSAWQNWIFTRPNAVGERGALTLYGSPDRPVFDWKRT